MPTEILTARGVDAIAAGEHDDFVVAQTFDARDRLTSTLLPENEAGQEWAYEYDEADNLITATDPNGHVSAHDFDSVNRQFATRFTRGQVGMNMIAPPGCDGSVADDRLPQDHIRCESSVTYDGLDQVVAQTDPDRHSTWTTFDDAGRPTDTYTQRTASTWVHAATRYDSDANPLIACNPRQFSAEGSGTCDAGAVHATHTAFDPAGRAVSTTQYRGPGEPLITDTTFDHDHNPVAVTDPKDDTTTVTYDFEGRRTTQTAPRSPGLTLETTTTYDPVGNVILERNPRDPAAGSGDVDYTLDSFTANSYDAAHRPLATPSPAPFRQL